MVVHGFDSQLAFSEKPDEKAVWQAIYTNAFGPCTLEYERRLAWQRRGVDVHVKTANRTWLIDEKLRRAEYPDILVELWSQWHSPFRADRTPTTKDERGWAMKDMDCDFIAYRTVSRPGTWTTCWLIPHAKLRDLARRREAEWVAAYGVKTAENVGYVTLNVPVPKFLLRAEIPEIRVIEYYVPGPEPTRTAAPIHCPWTWTDLSQADVDWRTQLGLPLPPGPRPDNPVVREPRTPAVGPQRQPIEMTRIRLARRSGEISDSEYETARAAFVERGIRRAMSGELARLADSFTRRTDSPPDTITLRQETTE